jgi:acid stress-induced BolA-like protein IbaG/YrbA
MGINEKVEAAIMDAFPGSSLKLEENTGCKLFGMMVSSRFAKMSDLERQKTLWKALRKSLTAAEQTQITAILTVTPDEDELLGEMPPDAD